MFHKYHAGTRYSTSDEEEQYNMASIRIPTPLRPYTGDNVEIAVAGSTVGEALRDLVTRHPELEPHLYNSGELRSFVNVFLGEDDVRYLDGAETPIADGDKLLIIPSIAGGCSCPCCR